MSLTLILILLKFLHVYVLPANPTDSDDQKLATCVVEAMQARPSELVLTKTKAEADVIFTLENQAKMRLHAVGTLTKPDGTLVVSVNHVTHGFNHGLCHQAEGLLDEMARKLSKR